MNKCAVEGWQTCKVLGKVPRVDRASRGRFKKARNLVRVVSILSPALLVAKDKSIVGITAAVDLAIKYGLLAEMAEDRKIVVVACATRPHFSKALLVCEIGSDRDETDDHAVFRK